MSTPRKAIGIDFGGTSIKSAVVQAGCLLERGEPIDPQPYASAETLVAAIVEAIGALRAVHPEVEAIGVGLPGFVDSLNGIVHGLTNVPGWNEVPLRDLLTARTGLPAIIENDANAMAFGEFKHGAARGHRHVICVTLGTGVGGALILDGRLYRGAQLAAGELGHTSIDYRGRPGPYGNFGGLEEYVGNHQISERAAAMYREAGRSVLPAQCMPLDLARAASRGDRVALGVWETVGLEIGCALANAVWILNPDAIIIGGGVANAGDLVFKPIIKTIRARTLPLFHEKLHVLPATLGNDAGIIGNAELALESV
jgi:glucokinase